MESRKAQEILNSAVDDNKPEIVPESSGNENNTGLV